MGWKIASRPVLDSHLPNPGLGETCDSEVMGAFSIAVQEARGD